MATNDDNQKLESCKIRIVKTLLDLEKAYKTIKIYDRLLDELNKDESDSNKFKNQSISCNELTNSPNNNRICIVCMKNCSEKSENSEDENCKSCMHKTEHSILQHKFEIRNPEIKVLPDDSKKETDNQFSFDRGQINDFLSTERQSYLKFIGDKKKKLSEFFKPELQQSSEKNDFPKIIKVTLLERKTFLEQEHQAPKTNNEDPFLTNEENEWCSKEANRIILEMIEELTSGILNLF
jgi:hypothetical protein